MSVTGVSVILFLGFLAVTCFALMESTLGKPASFRQIDELLAVEQLVSQPAEKRLRKAVLPRAARLDVQRLDSRLPQVLAGRRGDEPRAVVAAAVKIADKYGMHRTAKAPRLDYDSVKKRIEQQAMFASETCVGKAFGIDYHL